MAETAAPEQSAARRFEEAHANGIVEVVGDEPCDEMDHGDEKRLRAPDVDPNAECKKAKMWRTPIELYLIMAQPRNFARNTTGIRGLRSRRAQRGRSAPRSGPGGGAGGGPPPAFPPLAAAASAPPAPNPNGQASICTTKLRAELSAGQEWEPGVRGV
jgi:hypothetical protein